MQAARRALAPALLQECSTSSRGVARQWAAGFAKKAAGGDAAGGDTKIQKLLKVLEPSDAEAPPLSPELLAEAERRAKEYSRRKMQQHREWQADLTGKLKLKQAAIAALPEGFLRDAALVEDTAFFPANRMMWTETPPVEDAAQQQVQAQGSAKRRIGTKRR